MEVKFVVERQTPQTYRFKENLGPFDEPKIGTLYVRKSTLKEIGWQPDDSLVVVLKKGD